MDATNRLQRSGFWYTDLESANDAIAELRVRLDQRTARMAEYERVAIDESNSASMAKRERNAALARAEAAEAREAGLRGALVEIANATSDEALAREIKMHRDSSSEYAKDTLRCRANTKARAALAAAPLCPRCANRDNCCVATLDRFHDYDFARCKMFVEEFPEPRTR
jgi:hypothetical protein